MARISICIDVADHDQALAFYTGALGFELVKKGPEYSELSADGTTVYLAPRQPGSNPLITGEAARNYERHWTPVHLDVIVDDLDQCVSSVEALGGVKEGEKHGDWGSVVFCADPFGNGFCVLKFNS